MPRGGHPPHQIQAKAPTAPLLPLRPGQAERRTRDYLRHGTTGLFAALDVKAGRVIGACRPRHRSLEFRAFLDQIDANVPAELDVHLILDNAATHKARLIRDWLAKRPRYHLHLTPTSASWLNLVESWFALLSARQLKRGAFRSTGGAGGGDPALHRRHERGAEALRVDQVGRRDSRQRRPLLSTDF